MVLECVITLLYWNFPYGTGNCHNYGTQTCHIVQEFSIKHFIETFLYFCCCCCSFLLYILKKKKNQKKSAIDKLDGRGRCCQYVLALYVLLLAVFITRAIFKGLILRKFVSDINLCTFCLYVALFSLSFLLLDLYNTSFTGTHSSPVYVLSSLCVGVCV